MFKDLKISLINVHPNLKTTVFMMKRRARLQRPKEEPQMQRVIDK
jgi:hypothetical protein